MELLRRLLVGLLGMIDGVVYNLIDMIYKLLIQIAELQPFSNETFEQFRIRIYTLLGLFMLFKVSFSLIKYIVNPDDFNDKAKGGKKMVMNILVVLIMIVVSPTVFNWMGKVQQTILQEKVVENLILGPGTTIDNYGANMGKELGTQIFSAFYYPKEGAPDSVVSKYNAAKDANDVYAMIHTEVNGEPLFMNKMSSGDEYAIDYLFIISTIAGVFTAWIFLTFCIDIAIRTVKLGFLQLISPVPIISYIDPASSKNGMFSKWLKEIGKTYADLFIRLAAVYFAISLISSLTSSMLEMNNSFAKVFVIVGILIFANQIPKLIGELLGVKIDGNFSLNPMSKINSSPIAGAVVGGLAGGATGLASNIAANKDQLIGYGKNIGRGIGWLGHNADEKLFNGAVGNNVNRFKENAGAVGNTLANNKAVQLAKRGVQGTGKFIGATGKFAENTVGSPLAGGVSAMFRGAMAGSKGKGSALGAGVQGAAASSRARNARDGGYNAMDKLHDKFTDMAGLRSKTGTTSELGDEIKLNQQQIENYKQAELTYEQQKGNLMQSNPRSYMDAFKASKKLTPEGSVDTDKYGDPIIEKAYENYDSYFRAMTSDVSQTDIETKAEHIRSERGYANDERGLARAMQEARDEIAREHGIITERQYDDYAAINQALNETDEAARKLEKRNKELQGYLDAKSGKPKQ